MRVGCKKSDVLVKVGDLLQQEWASYGVSQIVLSTQDLVAAPTQENISAGVQFILNHRSQGNSVYVHCKAGRTRSATVVVCYLIQLHRWSPEQAIEYIRERRPHILIRKKQLDAITTFYDSVSHSCRTSHRRESNDS